GQVEQDRPFAPAGTVRPRMFLDQPDLGMVAPGRVLDVHTVADVDRGIGHCVPSFGGAGHTPDPYGCRGGGRSVDTAGTAATSPATNGLPSRFSLCSMIPPRLAWAGSGSPALRRRPRPPRRAGSSDPAPPRPPSASPGLSIRSSRGTPGTPPGPARPGEAATRQTLVGHCQWPGRHIPSSSCGTLYSAHPPLSPGVNTHRCTWSDESSA